MNTAELTFSPVKAAGDSTGSNVANTPAGMRPKLGALALPRWKPTTWGVAVEASAAPASGSVTVKLMAGGTEIASQVLALTGNLVTSSSVQADLSQVLGETELSVQLDVGAATDAGIVLTLYSRLEVNVLAQASGCVS